MKRQELFSVLTDCIRSKVTELELNEITEAHDFILDLGADSLQSVQILTCAIKRTGIKIPPSEVSHLMTVGEALDLLEKYSIP